MAIALARGKLGLIELAKMGSLLLDVMEFTV